jgi:hypothetical protein
MTKKEKNMLLYGGLAVVGVGAVITTIVLVSGGKKSTYGLTTPDKNKPPTTPQTASSPQSSYTPPKTSSYSQQDTIVVQTYLYKYYPQTIQRIGDIGTNGKPDGVWGNNTRKVVESVVSQYRWSSVDQILDYAKRGQAPTWGFYEVQGSTTNSSSASTQSNTTDFNIHTASYEEVSNYITQNTGASTYGWDNSEIRQWGRAVWLKNAEFECDECYYEGVYSTQTGAYLRPLSGLGYIETAYTGIEIF